ncbi:MAG TPA: DEAD/DEAH box helicase, partial [Fimbriimonadaceae bacterium]|nr:DEAD/DEAH box helicase [Fimbriimonadaceae bacterium]
MRAQEVADRFVSQPSLRERAVGQLLVEGRQARFADLSAPLHPMLSAALRSSGIERFFTHQAQAIDASLAGRDVMVVSGTGSGKSLCYNVPALQACMTEPAATALYLFPTKALAQDQASKLESLTDTLGIRVGVYDGDTPRNRRAPIRRGAHVVVTNPDMLHVGILPRHEEWSKFLRALRYIVLDEAHVYGGVFGSHVACVLRRLLRLCAWYRSAPRVVSCSASVANPEGLFETLLGRTCVAVTDDGAPHSARTVLLVAPPQDEAAERFSPNMEAASLLAQMCENGVKTLTFCRARVSTELVVRYARKALDDDSLVESYRGGYTPKERRDIERRLFDGSLTGLATTSAMELGIDVGGLDAVVLNGYPGNFASFWQQIGRAGRGEKPGFAVMFAHEDPLENHLAHNPSALIANRQESVALNPQNAHVLAAQLRCAAYERPLSAEDLQDFGESAQDVAEDLDDAGQLTLSAGRYFLPSHEPPAGKVDIRGIGGEDVELFCGAEKIGEMERWRAVQYAHEGAVYMHRAKTYQVTALDLRGNAAHMEESEPGYYTQPVVQTLVQPTVELEQRRAVALCGMSVTTSVTGFRKIAHDGRGMLGTEPLDLPPTEFDSVGLRLSPFEEGAAPAAPQNDGGRRSICASGEGAAPAAPNQGSLIGAVHGVEHALLAVAPMIAV